MISRGSAFLTILIIIIVAVASVRASDVRRSETVIVSDESELPDHLRPRSDSDVAGGPSGTATLRLPKECDKNPTSDECIAQKDRMAEPARQLAQEEAQMHEVDAIVNRLETLSNIWCCATTGLALFSVPGDRDVFNYGWHLLSQSFLDVGQTYGQQLIVQYHRRRTLPKYDCEGVKLHDAAEFELLPSALLEIKEMLVRWLGQNEVDSGPIVSNFFTYFRGTYGNWGIVRLLLQVKPEFSKVETPTVPEDAVFALLPLMRSNEETEQLCFVGGQLYAMYKRNPAVAATTSSRMTATIAELLDGCYKDGRIAKKPQVYGTVLLNSDREVQARELFDVAVQRGAICHPKQRPDNDMGHHKGLAASPFWALEDFPPEVRVKLGELIAQFSSDIENFKFSESFDVMQDFLEDESTAAGGRWERTTLYGNNMWNSTQIRSLSKPTLDRVKDTIDELIDSNDGYALGCNGSIVVETWRLYPPFATRRSVGPANIVLQLLAPLPVGSGHSLVLTAGDESMVLEEGEVGIMDDTFENVLRIESGGEDKESQPLTLLHIQLCHPEMHDKAMSLNQRRCPKKRRE